MSPGRVAVLAGALVVAVGCASRQAVTKPAPARRADPVPSPASVPAVAQPPADVAAAPPAPVGPPVPAAEPATAVEAPAAPPASAAPRTVWLDELDVSLASAGYGVPKRNASVDGRPLTIDGRRFERGLGTHARSELWVDLGGGATRFRANVGVDDEVAASTQASVEFVVSADGVVLYTSGAMGARMAAKAVDVDLAGASMLGLVVTAAGTDISFDHADWADASFEVTGAAPRAVAVRPTVWLAEIDLDEMSCGWRRPQANRSVEGRALAVGGRTFPRGVGTHADSLVWIGLGGSCTRFNALAGVDDEVAGADEASVEFKVIVDGREAWASGPMRSRQEAREVDVDLTGAATVGLWVDATGDGIDSDHADWLEARFATTGPAPAPARAPAREPYVLTPKPAPAPRINSPRVVGVRPGHEFLYTIAATGDRPMRFVADGLPATLTLDRSSGRITGRVAAAGEHRVKLAATNARGTARRDLRIVVGEAIGLTPPMGWNSWNCWAGAVDDAKVRSSARAIVESGLIDHGWQYVNIDDTWQAARGGEFHAIQGNEKFPAMKELCAYVHSLGLKIGIYSTPWITSYAGHIGGASDAADGAWDRARHGDDRKHGAHSFAANDARQWAAWGIDYLKYDWHVIDVPHVDEMARALRASGRDIVYSLSNSAPFGRAADWARLSNCWRTTGDIVDTWQSVSSIGFSQGRWAPFAGPGHWNDPDMLVVGRVGWGPNLHATRLTPDEQYAHISLWCLLAAPLLLGNDLASMDEFTLSLLTNDEVLEIDQDPLGRQATRVAERGGAQVWAKEMSDGSRAVGLFNVGPLEAEVVASWGDLGIDGRWRVRDLWRQQDVGTLEREYRARVSAHGVVLVRLSAAK